MQHRLFTRIEPVDASGAPIDRPAPSEERLRRGVRSMLERDVLCSIATVNPDGSAHVNTAFFSFSDELVLFFLSHPGSRHSRNLASNPSMAVCVFSTAQRWTAPHRGVQLFGTCALARGRWAREAERSYRARFPAHEAWSAGLAAHDPGRQYRFHRFRASDVKLLDERSFGAAVFVRAHVRGR